MVRVDSDLRQAGPCPQAGFSTQPSGRDQPVLGLSQPRPLTRWRFLKPKNRVEPPLRVKEFLAVKCSWANLLGTNAPDPKGQSKMYFIWPSCARAFCPPLKRIDVMVLSHYPMSAYGRVPTCLYSTTDQCRIRLRSMWTPWRRSSLMWLWGCRSKQYRIISWSDRGRRISLTFFSGRFRNRYTVKEKFPDVTVGL